MVRKFLLINEKGQQYSLMDIHNYCLLTDPDGLGYSYELSHEAIGELFVSTFKKQSQAPITGICNFLKYDNYTNLVNFIESSEKLRLSYTIPYSNKNAKDYFKDITLKSLEKTELQKNGVLSSPISFDMVSLWYEEKEYIYTIGISQDEVRWDFKWESRFMNYNSRKLEFNNQGHTSAPFYLEIDGPVLNPGIEIEDSNGNILFDLVVPIQLDLYEKFIYSSVDNQIRIAKQNIDGTLETLFKQKYIDIESNNIYKLPQGITKITVKADYDIKSALLKIYPYYRAV